MLRVMVLVARLLLVTVLSAASWHAFRFAAADWLLGRGTPASLERSAAWWPERAEPHVRLAALDPDHEREHLDRALAREFRSSQIRIHRALVAEFAGEPGQARRLLEEAMALDLSFRPVWAWLGFVARQNTPDEFWAHARRAFQMSHGDRSALLDLCWSVRPEAGFLLREVVSRQAPVLFDFVQFLMRQGELAVAPEAFKQLLGQPYGSVSRANAGRVATREERLHLGLDLCDLLLDRRQRGAASVVWRDLLEHGFVASEAAGRCFDLRRAPGAEGIWVTANGHGWSVEFSGRQPDEAELLWRPAFEAPPPSRSPDARLAWVRRAEHGQPRDVLVYRREPGQLPLRGAFEVERP